MSAPTKRVPREPTDEMVANIRRSQLYLSPLSARLIWCLGWDAATDADAGRVAGYPSEYPNLNAALEDFTPLNQQQRKVRAYLDRVQPGDRCAELERQIERLQDALSWMLPMAKGWAREHPVGRNAEIVAAAEALLEGKSDV